MYIRKHIYGRQRIDTLVFIAKFFIKSTEAWLNDNSASNIVE